MNTVLRAPRNWRNVAAGYLFLMGIAAGSFGISLDHLYNVRDDVSKTPVERVETLYQLLHDEIRSPAKPMPAYVGEIDHDYILCLIAGAMRYVAEKEPNAKALIHDKYNRELNAEAKQILALALCRLGEKTGYKELVQALKRKERNSLRLSAVDALSDAGVVEAIPDMIEALADHWEAPPESVIGRYPVRGFAALALVRMGVDVRTPEGVLLSKMAGPGQLIEGKIPNGIERGGYKVDRASAIRAIRCELSSKHQQTVVAAIEAIARVGGSAAKSELKRFIEEQERLPGTTDVVAKAQKVLSCMEADEK